MKTQYYHGTTTNLKIVNKILPPIDTGILRENWRKKNLNKVFYTLNFGQAMRYAVKAAKKYGGKPIVYSIVPKGQTDYLKDGEWICDYAIVINKTQ